MTALSDTVDLIDARHEAVVLALDMSASTIETLAGEALDALGIAGDAADLSASDVPNMRLALDVVVWRWIEARSALGFDFSADGGSYQRSQLFKQAAEMRRKAEDRAVAAGLAAYAWPAVEFEPPVNRSLDDEGQGYAGIYQW
jgi:hypothetical protein